MLKRKTLSEYEENLKIQNCREQTIRLYKWAIIYFSIYSFLASTIQ